jgi:hypothetical protein
MYENARRERCIGVRFRGEKFARRILRRRAILRVEIGARIRPRKSTL